jgi:hypothetical protein
MKKFSSGMTERNPVLDTDELLIKAEGDSGPEFCTVEKLFTGRAGASLGEGATDAYYGDKGKVAYDHSQSPHAPVDCLEYTAKLYQSGTNAPQASPLSDAIGVDAHQMEPKRWITFGRDGVGDYWVRINYFYDSPEAISSSQVAVFFGDAKCRLYAQSNGSDGQNNYSEWAFKSYTPEGVVADVIIAWVYITIKFYPQS